MTTRRDLLTGLGAMALTTGGAQAQYVSQLARGNSAVIAESAPIGRFGFILVDLEDGKVIEETNADGLFIPASLAKIPTSFTAMRVHGPRSSFATQLKAEGRIENGVLNGDLHLIGGGDPSLDTNGLVNLAEQLLAAGVQTVTGSFKYYATALPQARWLDKQQPWQAPYNPSMGGLNLNYNRVQFRWSRDGSVQFRVTRSGDELNHDTINGVETWTLRESLLTGRGNRWLPVRQPGAYTAGVFQQVCAESGITLPPPQESGGAPKGQVIAKHNSASIYEMLRGMMRYSNNLTAEALGASAGLVAGKRPRSIRHAAALTAQRTVKDVGSVGGRGWNGFALENHSGLSVLSRATPRQLAYVLRTGQKRWGDPYRALFNNQTMTAQRLNLPFGMAAPDHSLYGKTGSMHFVRGLAGYLTIKDRPMAYAFMANEDESRNVLNKQFAPYSDPAPTAAANWSRRTKAFEQAMLREWILRYSA